MPAAKKPTTADQDKTTGKFVKGNRAAARKTVTEELDLPDNATDKDLDEATRTKLKKYAQGRAKRALEIVDEIMRAKDTKPSDKLRCAELILAYAHGKPGTAAEETDTDVKIVMEGVDEYSK